MAEPVLDGEFTVEQLGRGMAGRRGSGERAAQAGDAAIAGMAAFQGVHALAHLAQLLGQILDMPVLVDLAFDRGIELAQIRDQIRLDPADRGRFIGTETETPQRFELLVDRGLLAADAHHQAAALILAFGNDQGGGGGDQLLGLLHQRGARHQGRQMLLGNLVERAPIGPERQQGNATGAGGQQHQAGEAGEQPESNAETKPPSSPGPVKRLKRQHLSVYANRGAPVAQPWQSGDVRRQGRARRPQVSAKALAGSQCPVGLKPVSQGGTTYISGGSKSGSAGSVSV